MATKKRKRYSCDFETTTKIDDCRVWAYGFVEIGNHENYRIGNSLNEFMDFVNKCNSDLYFHNLRFDGSFIINYLLKAGFKVNEEKESIPNTFKVLISNMGQWYMIDICYNLDNGKPIHTKIMDSLKKLPFPVKKIAKDFGMDIEKGDIDYHKERPIGYEITDEEKDYLLKDILIVAKALEIQFNDGQEAMTNGADSLNSFKEIIGKKVFKGLFPVFSAEEDEKFRPYYKGGFTWLNEIYADKEIGEGVVFDVNSLYPAMMKFKMLPFGVPEEFDDKYLKDKKFPLYMQKINCEFELKEGYIPTIQIKKNLLFRQNEYLKNSNGEPVNLYLTNVDMELFFEHYDVYNIRYEGGFKFRGRVGIFDQFIDKFMEKKIKNKGALKLLAKLILNSLYGKFASHYDVTGKIPFLKEDGSNGYKAGMETFKDPIYTPMGAFITAWARHMTIGTAQKCYDRIIYCDTDSIHLVGLEMPEVIKDMIHNDDLGKWAHESTFIRAKYIRQKTYMYEIRLDKPRYYIKNKKTIMTNSEISVKCAGMSENIKKKVTFENFKVGFKSSGKLLQKNVSGGVVLVDTDFTLKG